ncbi:hypothetical protein N7507_008394 [Penicillium longicatenatum]|nr:hypothetical protein N7507_008394 [Penicillium longicatenatum]
MDNSDTLKLSIAGDLPNGSAQAQQKDPGKEWNETQVPVQSAQINNAVDEPPKPITESEKTTLKLDEAVAAVIGPQLVAQMQKKKKRERGPRGKRGVGKPTGFEEWSADGPLTPDEYKQNCGLYDPHRSFIDRLEEAFRRFERKRRIEPARSNIFHKYLQYGGVSIGPNFGGGVNAQDMKMMTSDEIMLARAQTLIERERESLHVSFDKVARGFFGTYFLRYFNPDCIEDIEFATSTIRNFLTFLLFHDVCPEYKNDILEARKICTIANMELWKNLQLIRKGPGEFNKACSMLFAGHYFNKNTGKPNIWDDVDDSFMTTEKAQDIVKHCIAGAGSHDVASSFRHHVADEDLLVESVEDIDGFEVLRVTEPDDYVRAFYQEFAAHLTPVGIVKAKSFRDPGKPQTDLSPKERWDWDHGKAPSYDFVFFIERDLLDLFYPGLRVMAPVWKMNCGAYYFDQVYSTFPSFNAIIANDMMLSWKRPRDLRNDSPKSKEPENEINQGIDDAAQMAFEATGQKKNEGKCSKDFDIEEDVSNGEHDTEEAY